MISDDDILLIDEPKLGATERLYLPQIADGLKLSGYFLERHVFAPQNRKLPAARERLAERLAAAPG